jgi:hypothetical protein
MTEPSAYSRVPSQRIRTLPVPAQRHAPDRAGVALVAFGVSNADWRAAN